VHEFSIASAVSDTAIRHAGGRQVMQVNLRVGALRQVVPSSLDFYFAIVTRDTLCDGARLEQEPVSALLRCGDCGEEWDPAPPPAEEEGGPLLVPSFRCPCCRQGGASVVRGEELEVESIEVVNEEPDPAQDGGAWGAAARRRD
jgi:hydrogenase nickel incorporation protein HypA/HybF